MARQYKIEVLYAGGIQSSFYWHENDQLEFEEVLPLMTATVIAERANTVQNVINFCKIQGITKIEIAKLI